MATRTDVGARHRAPLSRELVLGAAVALADRVGVGSLSMRRLAQELGVVPMALYKHVAGKDELLDGMVDVVMGEINDLVGEIEAPPGDWKPALRRRVLSAREVLLRHPWAPGLMESRTSMSPPVLRYYDALIGLLLDAGFSIDLTHHALHALGSRALGFTQELYDDSAELDPDAIAVLLQQLGDEYPRIIEMVSGISHDASTALGWCDDQEEFEFALDLTLDGLERLRDTA